MPLPVKLYTYQTVLISATANTVTKILTNLQNDPTFVLSVSSAAGNTPTQHELVLCYLPLFTNPIRFSVLSM